MRASLLAQLVKNPPAMLETWVRPLGWEDPLEKGKAPSSEMLGGEGCPTRAPRALERQHVGLKREPSWRSSRACPVAKLRAAQPRGTGCLWEYVPGSRPLCSEGSMPSRAWCIQCLKHCPGEAKPTLCSGSD